MREVTRKKNLSLFIAAVLLPCASPGQEAVAPLRFNETVHDFQTVREEGGAVDFEFTFENEAGRAVKILTVRPSCGCTTPAWSREAVAPGATGFIKASFDPKGRPGYFNKTLTVTTDYSAQPLVLQIKGNVVTAADAANPASAFRIVRGSLMLQAGSFNLGKVPIRDEPFRKEFQVFNNGSAPLMLKSVRKPAYLDAEMVPAKLGPQTPGTLVVTLDAKRKNAYGFITESIALETDDAAEPVKDFAVYATLEEYFPPLSPKELELAPRMVLDTMAVGFMDVRMGTSSTQSIRLVNAGKKDLVIRAIQPNCTCVQATMPAMTVRPGMSAELKITFSPTGKTGAQQKAVTLHVNDPRNPVQRVVVSARVI
jgi:hypothetical protein